ncbi:hypothetical protein SSPO_049150 [Streptomyces antimycoticus]|uniref:Uncharacterized protein n=1 Tax=Streptomyces antimycoticus TaxID=68175 RepID=A0A499V7T0_9ACTN|nr:hypothetical protein SSPO_049150 [Streptomyces antimycoticus]
MAGPAGAHQRPLLRAPLGVRVLPALRIPVVMGNRRALRIGLTALIPLILLVLLNAPPTSFPRRAGPLTPTAWAPVVHRAGRRNPWSTEKSGHVVISSTLAQRRASGIRRWAPSAPVRHRDYTPPEPSFAGLAASPVTRTPCVKHMTAPAFPR